LKKFENVGLCLNRQFCKEGEMMKFYIHNARGFTDQEIEIKDVNFLVGENSTGKTSFMGLLDMITGHAFLDMGKLINENYKWGSFGEILNEDSNEDFYQLGTHIRLVDLPYAYVAGFTDVMVVYKFTGDMGKIQLAGLSFANESQIIHYLIKEELFSTAKKPRNRKKAMTLKNWLVFKDH
jgi:predicted ATPase